MTDLTVEQMRDIFLEWKMQDYEVSKLDALIEGEEEFPVEVFELYQRNIETLGDIAEELKSLDARGFDVEASRVKDLLYSPEKVDEAQAALQDLKNALRTNFFTGVMHTGMKVVKKTEKPMFELIPKEGGPKKGKKRKSEELKPVRKLKQEAAPAAAAPVPEPEPVNLEPGFCYLLEEEIPDKSYKLFEDVLKQGRKGLCITREFPNKIKKRYHIDNARIIWLSSAEAEYAIEPVKLGNLFHHIEQFIKTEKETVILLSGLEYLISQNNYSAILKLIQLINDVVSMEDSIFIVPVSPQSMDQKDLKMIERELTVVK